MPLFSKLLLLAKNAWRSRRSILARNTRPRGFARLPPELLEEVFLYAAGMLAEELGQPSGRLDDHDVRELQRWQLSLCLVSRQCLYPGRRSAYQELWAEAFGAGQLCQLLPHLDNSPWRPARHVSLLSFSVCPEAWSFAERHFITVLLLELPPRMPCLRKLEFCSYAPLPLTGDEMLARLTTSQLEDLSLASISPWQLDIAELIVLILRCPLKQLRLFGVTLLAPSALLHTPHVLDGLRRKSLTVQAYLADFQNESSLPPLVWALGPSLHCLRIWINKVALIANGENVVDFSALSSDLPLFPKAGQYLQHLVIDMSPMSDVLCQLPRPPRWLLGQLVHLELLGNFEFCLLALFKQLPASLVSFSARGEGMECIIGSFIAHFMRVESCMPCLASFALSASTDRPFTSGSEEAFVDHIKIMFAQRSIKTNLQLVCDLETQCDGSGRSCYHCNAWARSGGIR